MAREDAPGDRRLVAYLVADRGRPPTPRSCAGSSSRVAARVHGPVGVRGPRRPAADAQRQGRPRGPARPRAGPAARRTRRSCRRATPIEEASRRSGRPCWASSGSAPTTTSSTWAATRCWPPRSSRGSATRSASRCRSAPSSRRPTVAGLAERIEAACGPRHGPDAPPIAPVRARRELPLSFAQQALWFLDQLAPGQPTFNVTPAVRIARAARRRRPCERAFDEIVRRHEALRTTFAAVDGQPVQVDRPATSTCRSPSIDLRRLARAPTARPRPRGWRSRRRAGRSTWPAGPLVRAGLLRLGDTTTRSS